MPDFLDIRFPEKISYGSVGGPSYASRVLSNPAGREQIITLWDASKIEWTFDRKVWTDELVTQLLDFWHVVGGIGPGFRFKDWSDYYIGMRRLTPNAALTHDAALAHEFAEGDGAETEFQLERVRSFGAHERRVKITRPVADDFVLYEFDDPDWVEIESGFTLNASTGLVTFDVAPADGLRLAWGGKYDYPVRFAVSNPNLTLSAMMTGNMTGLRVVGLKE